MIRRWQGAAPGGSPSPSMALFRRNPLHEDLDPADPDEARGIPIEREELAIREQK